MKINKITDGLYKFYLIGFYIIFSLPLFVLPPWFLPVDWGKTIVFRSILAIILFLFLYQLFCRSGEVAFSDIKKNKIVWVLALFFIWVVLATIFSQDISFSLWGSPYRAQGAVNFLFYLIFPVLSFLILKPSAWNKILNFSIFVGILVCFIAIIQFYGLFNNIFIPDPDGRPPSTMGNPIMLGIYLLLLFFITLFSAIKEKKSAYRIFYLFGLLLFFLTISITGSRAVYLGLIFGGIYFFFFYRTRNKRVSILKACFAILLILGIFMVYYASSQKSLPQFLEKNTIFQAVKSRLSFETVLRDPRFSAWQITLKGIKEKPILGWGPENLNIGFDKYYDPSLPFISKQWGGWWDRAHNIILDTAVTSGIPAAIIYLILFIVLFWQLQKSKKRYLQLSEINGGYVTFHGIQATLIAYFTANFFSFDCFSTYLLFTLIIGYSLHLTCPTDVSNENRNALKQTKGRNILTGISLVLLILFIWQYNIVPLQINAQINKADNLAENKKCEQSFAISENNILKKHSFLDAYAIIHYIEDIKKCAEVYPEKNLEYAQKGAEQMKKAVKVRPSYARLWIYLGSFTTIEANSEQDLIKKDILIKEAFSCFEKAEKLAPNHQEILVEQAKTDMVAGNYQAMKEKSEKCIALDETLGDCYWVKALSEIYLKDAKQAKEDIKTADKKRFNTTSVSSLHQLASAYAAIENYKDLAAAYNQLIKINPDVPEYHSSLAFTYAKMQEYKKAREEAMIFLQLMPEAKDETDAFLRMLPY